MTNTKSTFLLKSGSAIFVSMILGLLSLAPYSAFAKVPREAFKSECVRDAITQVIGNAKVIDSNKISISAPAIAENGAEVKISVLTGNMKNVEEISIFAEKNPTPLLASYQIPKGISMQIGGRVKMLETQNVVAIVKADGKYYRTTKQIKVTIGGCGGGAAFAPTISKSHCK